MCAHSFSRWLITLTYFFLFGGTSQAEVPAICSTSQSITTNFSKLQCALSCEDYWRTHPLARPEVGSTAYCEGAESTIARVIRGSTWEECATSLWQGLHSFAEKARLYLALIAWTGKQVHAHLEERTRFLEDCNHDNDCRRVMGRALVENMGRDQNGNWLISDAELDKKLTGQNVQALKTRLDQQGESLKRACDGVLAELAPSWNNLGLEGNGLAQRRFEQVVARAPQCVGPLRLSPPPPREVPAPFKKLGIRLECYDQKRAFNLACMQVGKTVADPLVLIPGAAVAGAALVKKATELATLGFFEAELQAAADLRAVAADAGPFNPRAFLSAAKPELGSPKVMDFEPHYPVLPGETDPLSKAARSLNASGVNTYVKDFTGTDLTMKAYQSTEYQPDKQKLVPIVVFRRSIINNPEGFAGTINHEKSHALNVLRAQSNKLVGQARLIEFKAESGRVLSGDSYAKYMRIDEVHARAVQSSTQLSLARNALAEGHIDVARDQVRQASDVITTGVRMKSESSDHLALTSKALLGSNDYSKKTGVMTVKISTQNGSRVNVQLNVGKFLAPDQANSNAVELVNRAQRDLNDMITVFNKNRNRLHQLQQKLESLP